MVLFDFMMSLVIQFKFVFCHPGLHIRDDDKPAGRCQESGRILGRTPQKGKASGERFHVLARSQAKCSKCVIEKI